MATSLSDFGALLKQFYNKTAIENLTYKNRPFFALVNKDPNIGGISHKVPIITSNGGVSASFSTARTNSAGTQSKAFEITTVKKYAVRAVEGQLFAQSKTDPMSFMRALKTETDSGIIALTNALATELYRSGTGSIGVCTTGAQSTTITLNDPADIVNFAVGQVLVASTTDGGALLSGTATVSAVGSGSLTSATITLSANFPAAWDNEATLYLYQEGNAANGGDNVCISGLAAWIPTTAPTTSLFGVPRTGSAALGGLRASYTGAPLDEALVDASMLVFREGGSPDYCFMNPKDFATLEKTLGAKVQYVDVKATAGIGFKAIEVHGGATTIKVIADPYCPAGKFYLLTMDNWCLESAGAAPTIFDADGLTMLRQSDADAIEVRVNSYAQLRCNAPGWSMVGSF